jgi:hypothetical protein
MRIAPYKCEVDENLTPNKSHLGAKIQKHRRDRNDVSTFQHPTDDKLTVMSFPP